MLTVKSLLPVSALGLIVLVLPSAASAEIDFGINSGGINNDVCLVGTRVTTFQDSNDCGGTELTPTRLQIGSPTSFASFDSATGAATFTGAVNFNSNNVQFNTSNVSFGGGSATFNNTVSFVGPSVTFMTGTTFTQPATFNNTADFNNTVTTAGLSNTGNITNTGTITTANLVGTAVNTTNFLATGNFVISNGATVTMGGNIVQNVAAGVADTDAVNVGQLNAATSGIVTDVTALETVTATHTTQITNLQSGLADTNTALADVDTRVDALETITANLDERFDDVQDRSDAGTATAVALSGAMFLPGKTFNLTGNVGVYRGAVAGAMQLGALVSHSVALNAGVAHGFNKGGKAAARVGFTLGF